MNNKYTITFFENQTNIEVEVEYADGGALNRLSFPQDLKRETVEWCYNRIPMDERDLVDTPKLCKIEQVPQDLSFPVFWELYAHKIGDKKRATILWGALT